MNYKFIKTLTAIEDFNYRFSICTLVSKPAQYQEMVDSFISAGFDTTFCEYLCIDNTEANIYDGYSGLNRFLREARGKYVILCHQDIVLNDHNCSDLELRIAQMDSLDPNWAILSNAGGINFKYLAMHLIQKCGNKLIETVLPLKAQTVDENFILVKKEANIALSHDLRGFHMYGTDICLISHTLGFNSYIIDFNLTHKSNGTVDHRFYAEKMNLMLKYRRAFKARYLATTITRMYISGNRISFFFGNLSVVKFFVRQYYKFFRRKKNYQPASHLS